MFLTSRRATGVLEVFLDHHFRCGISCYLCLLRCSLWSEQHQVGSVPLKVKRWLHWPNRILCSVRFIKLSMGYQCCYSYHMRKSNTLNNKHELFILKKKTINQQERWRHQPRHEPSSRLGVCADKRRQPRQRHKIPHTLQ